MNPTIFIVDDDPFFRSFIKSILTKIGFNEIITFSSGEDCIDNLNLYPNIIILDYEMNGMSGAEVLRFLHNSEHHIPVIMVSSQENENIIAQVIQLGVKKYIKKDKLLCQNLQDYFNTINMEQINYQI